MSNEIKTTTSGGFPVLGLLGAVLVILKVLGKISLSWFWVLAPFWAGLILVLVLIAVMVVVAILAAVLGS